LLKKTLVDDVTAKNISSLQTILSLLQI